MMYEPVHIVRLPNGDEFPITVFYPLHATRWAIYTGFYLHGEFKWEIEMHYNAAYVVWTPRRKKYNYFVMT